MPVSNFQDQHKVFHHYLDIFYRRKWYIVIPFLLAMSATLSISYWLPREYLSTTMILVERQKVPEDYVKSTVTSSISDRLQTISQQVLSRVNLLRLIDEFSLYHNEMGRLGEEAVIQKLRNKIELKVVNN